MKSDNPPDNPPDRPPERRWPWSASARLPPSTTLGATFKQGRTRSRCHLDYFGNGTARRRNTAVTVRKGMGGGSRTEVAVRRFAPYQASSTRSAPPLCEAWLAIKEARPFVRDKGGAGAHSRSRLRSQADCDRAPVDRRPSQEAWGIGISCEISPELGPWDTESPTGRAERARERAGASASPGVVVLRAGAAAPHQMRARRQPG